MTSTPMLNWNIPEILQTTCLYTHINTYYRKACAIPDGENVLLTGGYYSRQRVSRYDAAGYVAELPGLNIGRYDPGCGVFLRQDGTKVSTGCVSMCAQ